MRGADVAHTPIALGLRLAAGRASRPTLYVEPEKISQKTRGALEKFTDIAPPSRLLPDLRDAGAKAQTILFDAATAPVKLVETLRAAGGEPRLGDDPVALPKAIKNETRARRRESRSCSRRRRADALSRLVRDGGARGRPHRNRGGAGAGDISARGRTFAGYFLPDDFRVRSARGDPALSGRRGQQSARSGAAFISSIPARNIPMVRRTSRAPCLSACQTAEHKKQFYPRAQRPHCHCNSAISRRHVPARSSTRWRGNICGKRGWTDHGIGHGVGAYLSVHEGPQRISKRGRRR